jgi:hypothetical protein
MPFTSTRREFVHGLGLSAAALPFVMNLPGLAGANQKQRKQRLVVLFSPNGVVPKTFWPADPQRREGPGEGTPELRTQTERTLQSDKFTLPESLTPLEPFKSKTLVLKGVCDKVRGDGDNHMRGIGCLLTGVELYPGNIQGGSHTPAGWASGVSIDQEIKNHLQKKDATHTRFGSLEFGVLVPDRADTWTRMVYSGPNKPVAPVNDPYQMFAKLYGKVKDRELLASVLDDVKDDLKRVSKSVGAEDRRLLEEQTSFVREMEQELRASAKQKVSHKVPELEPGVKAANDNIPRLSKMQIDLLVNSFTADFARVATLQYTNSVGGAKMKWLGVNEGHHELSHEPDNNAKAQEKLTKINKWFCAQVAYLAKRLSETPEPGGSGSLLDNTLIVWTNELGKGNSHTLDDIPFVLVGGGLDFKMGRSLKLPRAPHNRLLLSLAHGFGHQIKRFGNADFCGAGPLSLS